MFIKFSSFCKFPGSGDFAQALNAAKPSITTETKDWYDGISQSISNAMPKKADKVFYG